MAETDPRHSLRRYVTYQVNEPPGEAAWTGGKAVESAGPGPGPGRGRGASQGHGEAAGTQHMPSRESEPPSEAMADLHLSGSDPRMFPGIFTRAHQSGSLRNLAQAENWPVDSSEAPGEEDE